DRILRQTRAGHRRHQRDWRSDCATARYQRRNRDHHRPSASTMAATNGLFIQADLGTAEGCEQVVRQVHERLGGIDILINNVGGSTAPGGGFAALTDDDWLDALNSNLLSAVRLDRGLLSGTLERRSGVIIHVSSIQ